MSVSYKILKIGGKESFYAKFDANNLLVIKWLDQRCVHVITNFKNPEIATVERWSKREKKYNLINCPEVVEDYNDHMGGVYLNDMLVALQKSILGAKNTI